MLAKQSKFKFTALVILGSLVWAVSSASAQQPQPPSQRYQPVRSAPPNVHVPAPGARQLNQAGASDNLRTTQTNAAGTSFNFSDAPQSNAAPPQQNNSGVRQVAYQQPLGKSAKQPFATQIDPRVPLNLRGDSNTPADYFRPANPSKHQTRQAQQAPPQSSRSFSNSQPRVDAQSFNSHHLAGPATQAPPVHNRTHATPIQLAAKPRAYEASNGQVQSGQVQQVAFTKQEDEMAAEPQSNSLSTLRGLSSLRSNRAQQAVAQMATDEDNNVRQTAATMPTNPEGPGTSIQLSTPAMVVNTYGPTTVGIHKTAIYKVTCKNDSDRDAERVLIGIDMPQWVDLQNINATGGQHEITDGNQQARLKWIVDRIPANTTHTISINAVPRKAEMFDLGVDWAFAPRTGSAHVTVTEPKLEMKISGPNDVLYGEKAIYHVTVSNPGTGAAEKVSVMLPEALGGERASLGNIAAGSEKNFQVELFARKSGNIDLAATAVADGQLEAAVDRKILVRRANLNVAVQGPKMKYSGTNGQFAVTIMNQGDAPATDVTGALALPPGVKYLSGVNGAQQTDSGLRWPVGTMNPGDKRTYQIICELNASGNLQIEAGARGAGDLAASGACVTAVETIADLVLSVDDPKGPLPTGEKITYQIRVKNRGTKSADSVNLVMQFSDGIEPTQAIGLQHKLVPGQVLFSPIQRIDPGQEMVFKVEAKASKSGTHIFRAQLTCDDSDSREIAEGTTRFFGESTAQSMPQPNMQLIESPFDANTADAENRIDASDSNDFSR